jgi:tetratricopeptide (TPR) repeat protein
VIIIPLGIGVFLTFLAAMFALLAWTTEYRLATEEQRPASNRWLIRWGVQGLLAPAFIWVLMNLGISLEVQSFMPKLQKEQGTSLWFPLFCAYTGGGLAVISSYWSAMTLGWILWRVGAPLEGETWEHFRGLCWTSLLGMLVPAALFVWVGGWLAVGLAITAIFAPIAGYAPAILRPRKMPPMYARAIARMKFGKYSEAEEEVIKQLERRDDDFEGWLMLADLYANHFSDIAEAEQTILEICDQPRTNPGQLSIALHKLADWYLKLKGDPDAARRALEVIVNRLPGTHLARMAQLRAAQLPRTAEEFREQQLNKPVHLPALHDPLDDGKVGPATVVDPVATRQRAAQLEARVKAQPTDPEPREELARLCAGALGQPDAAIAHLEQLLVLLDQLPEKRAGWVAMIATWQIEGLKDRAAGCETLRRIIREFPQTPTAFAAQRRLLHLDQEEKLRQARKPPPIPRIRIEMDGTSR